MKFQLVKGYKKIPYGRLVQRIIQMRRRLKSDRTLDEMIKFLEDREQVILDRKKIYVQLQNKGWIKEVAAMTDQGAMKVVTMVGRV